ncbi:hypothetical protein [Paenibacillus dendritiformis]|uniref:hypothetical protein n=1 Tax=Paenibacillus dendritiformis TaxID=130049 RepID=UPI001BD1B232|nr:hypothetical protein [Paenibacillus dendritiformis]
MEGALGRCEGIRLTAAGRVMFVRDLRLRLEARIRILVAPYVPGLAAARIGMAAAWIAVVVVRMMRLAFLALALVVMMPLWFAFLAFAVVMMMPLWLAFLAFAVVMMMPLWLAFLAFAVVMMMPLWLAFLAFAVVMMMMMPLWLAFLAFAVVMMMPLALMAVRLAAASRHIHRSLFAAARFPFYFHDPAPFDIAQPLHEHILTNDVILFGQIEFQLLSTGIFNLKFG